MTWKQVVDTSTPGVTCQLKAGTDGDQVDAYRHFGDDRYAVVEFEKWVRFGKAKSMNQSSENSKPR